MSGCPWRCGNYVFVLNAAQRGAAFLSGDSMANGELIFVYGTLMSSAVDPMGREARRRLRIEAVRLGAGGTPGRLFDLGHYPGLVVGEADATVVQGEVLRLHDPERSFRWLDAYEGIDPRPGAANEYRRMQRPVSLDMGSEVEAWVYVYCRDCRDLPLISSGRWTERTAP